MKIRQVSSIEVAPIDMSSEKIPFTRSALASVPKPEKGRTAISDEQTRGLVLYVQASGTRTFYVYRKIGGTPLRVLLGRFSPTLPETRDFPAGTDPLTVVGNSAELNVRMARKVADAVNASLDKGIDPGSKARQERQQRQSEMTLRQAFDKYFTDHLVAHEKRSAELMKDDFARYLGKVAPGQKKPRGKERQKSAGAVDWEERKLSAISSAEIRQMMINMKESTGSRTANRVYVLLRSIYNRMIAWKLYFGQNPCEGVDKFKEVSRERYVTGDELPRFLAAVEKVAHQDFKDFILLSLFTAARRENVLAMRWQDLNFHGGTWTVPGEFSKNGSALTIPLTDYVRDILERRRSASAIKVAQKASRDRTKECETEGSQASPYVFPASSGTGHMAPPNKRWKALLVEAKLEDLRLHDLRRTFGSWAAAGNTSLPLIGRMLGHKSSRSVSMNLKHLVESARV